jgi:hypothetical protein
MKKIPLFLFVLLFSLKNFGQKNINLIVLASGGEKFYLILNGVKYNTSPEASVKAMGLKSGTYEATISFDQNIPEIKDKIYTIWEGKETDNMEFTYVIEKKGSAYRIRFLSNAELPSSTAKTDSTKQKSDTSKVVQFVCKGAMSEKDFGTASQSVGARSIEDSRLSMAQALLEKNCFTVNQLSEICALFEYDQTRLEFLKKAYERCTDKANYNSLQSSFEYKKTQKDFSEWMIGK